MRVVSNLSSGTLPDAVRASERAFGSTASQARSMRDELAALPAVMQRAQELKTIGDKPIAIVTAEQDAMEGWLPLQVDLTHLSTNSSPRSVPDATHPSLVDDEHDAANASRAILDVVQAVRAHSMLTAPAAPAPSKDSNLTVPRPTTPVDQLVDVNGARMHVRCAGAGPATAVLIAGFETSSEVWDAVTPTAARQTRFCSYDRYGTGTSDPAPPMQTFATQAADLHAALTSLGEPGPYVVVGHSFGGSEAVSFAAKYRNEVNSVLLVDASPANWPATLCAVPDDGTPAAAGYQQLCSNVSTPADNTEHLDGVTAFAEVRTIDTLHDLPMVVLTAEHHPWGLAAAENARLDDVWHAGQDHWLTLSPTARLVTVGNTGHNIQIDQPGAVVTQIEQLIR
jgi:pimeloyl-ACP methyl ester carboxylesterase